MLFVGLAILGPLCIGGETLSWARGDKFCTRWFIKCDYPKFTFGEEGLFMLRRPTGGEIFILR